MKQNKSPRSLTTLYCLHQAAYFFAIAGIGAFAVTYLLDRGFSSASIGIILALTNILSCALQPMIGSFVDRRSSSLLPRIILVCLITAFVCLTVVELFPLPLLLTGLLFALGSLTFSMTIPLSNSLCAYYSCNRYRIDYGMGSGVGSLSFSFASLAYGYIIAWQGSRAMMLTALAFILLQMALILRYPRVASDGGARSPGMQSASSGSLSIPAFCRRYRFFILTMSGVMCLAACHAMAENYLIQLFTRIGGGSENVGVALFLACTTAAPFLMLFERIQRRTGVVVLMRLSGVFYVVKAVSFIFASSVASIYLVELLQTFTYCFLYPSLYYLVIRRIDPADMAKGQMLASALYTLGTAIGNSIGGTAIDVWGLNAMLLIAAVIAACGTLLVHFTIDRRDTAA